MKKTTIIVDTSVIIKWLLPDEYNLSVIKIKNNFASKNVTIVIPYLTYYEVSSVLSIAVRRQRVDEETCKELLRAFTELEFVVYATKELFAQTLIKSVQYNISSYDAAYIALSEELQIPFITADEKLIKKVNNNLIVNLKVADRIL